MSNHQRQEIRPPELTLGWEQGQGRRETSSSGSPPSELPGKGKRASKARPVKLGLRSEFSPGRLILWTLVQGFSTGYERATLFSSSHCYSLFSLRCRADRWLERTVGKTAGAPAPIEPRVLRHPGASQQEREKKKNISVLDESVKTITLTKSWILSSCLLCIVPDEIGNIKYFC